MNSFGKIFRITSFGESHGKVIGIVVDGCPSGLKIDIDFIQNELNRRRPGQSDISTSRSEEDKVKIISGVMDNYSTGAPICMIIENKDKDSSKYDFVKKAPRPSHADYPAIERYGKWVDLRGSGRFSGRNTAGFVMAGSIAKLLLKKYNIIIAAYTKKIYNIEDPNNYSIDMIIKNTEKNPIRTVDSKIAEQMKKVIFEAKQQSDSVGGIITCKIEGVPPGIGEPMFNSLESQIAAAMFSIPAVKAIEFGVGFRATDMKGSEHNDPYEIDPISKKIITKTNNSGGIIGGITNGMPIVFNIAIKPTASIGLEQNTIDLEKMENIKLKISGRHDPCIVPRAVPVVEAMAAIVLTDFLIFSGFIPKIIQNNDF
ncbi:MAG: chorismate synthase [Promethearchaeota archaeon]